MQFCQGLWLGLHLLDQWTTKGRTLQTRQTSTSKPNSTTAGRHMARTRAHTHTHKVAKPTTGQRLQCSCKQRGPPSIQHCLRLHDQFCLGQEPNNSMTTQRSNRKAIAGIEVDTRSSDPRLYLSHPAPSSKSFIGCSWLYLSFHDTFSIATCTARQGM